MSQDSVTAAWAEANQRHLVEAVHRVRAALARHAGGAAAADPRADSAAEEDAGGPFALERVVQGFGLSPFERDLLVLCAGPELEAEFGEVLRAAGHAAPTFALALAALPDAHWSALAPGSPLRHWKLIEVAPGGPLVTSALRIDERILHYLAGAGFQEDRLEGIATHVQAASPLAPSQQAVAEQMIALWARPGPGPGICLRGEDRWGMQDVAAVAAAGVGLALHVLRGADIPAAAAERVHLARLWERAAVLGAGVLLIDLHEDPGPETVHAATSFADLLRTPFLLVSRGPVDAGQRLTLSFDVAAPDAAEQRTLWREALGEAAAAELNGALDGLVAQFRLRAREIVSATAQAAVLPADALPARLWEACRAQARPRLDDLAQRIEPAASWDELVLPAAEKETLRQVVAHVRQRARVYEEWGFAGRGQRGLGISALFAGPSGTGKTLAAEVIARELELDLYRIDLSQVVSKYIGETEKNLRRVFDAAEAGGAVLLFDEADALFGKRSEVKDSHDRYANIEVSFLLQRMEAYRGLAILTSNLRNALDEAFLRRLRFIVSFPFPGEAERAEIWRRVFPLATPLRALSPERLAQLNVSGGNIRNIALHAAFLAAEAGDEVAMGHLLRAARGEYAKLERPLGASETGGWT